SGPTSTTRSGNTKHLAAKGVQSPPRPGRQRARSSNPSAPSARDLLSPDPAILPLHATRSGELSPPPTPEPASRVAPPAAVNSKKEPPALDDPDCIAALNRQAGVIQNVCFPSQALAALSLDDTASVSAMRLVLARFREEAGSPSDPVEKLLLDQLMVAH